MLGNIIWLLIFFQPHKNAIVVLGLQAVQKQAKAGFGLWAAVY